MLKSVQIAIGCGQEEKKICWDEH